MAFLQKLHNVLHDIKLTTKNVKIVLQEVNLLAYGISNSCSEYLSLITIWYPSYSEQPDIGASFAILIAHIFISNPEYLKKSGVILSNISDYYAIFSALDLKSASFSESFVEIPKRIVVEEVTGIHRKLGWVTLIGIILKIMAGWRRILINLVLFWSEYSISLVHLKSWKLKNGTCLNLMQLGTQKN